MAGVHVVHPDGRNYKIHDPKVVEEYESQGFTVVGERRVDVSQYLNNLQNPAQPAASNEPELDGPLVALVGKQTAKALADGGFPTLAEAQAASPDDLSKVKGVGETTVAKLHPPSAPESGE